MGKFKIGDQVKINTHDWNTSEDSLSPIVGEVVTICEVGSSSYKINCSLGNDIGWYSEVRFDEIEDIEDKLIDVNMDIEDIKEFPKTVLVEAEKLAKDELAKSQVKIAADKFTQLFSAIAEAEAEVTRAQKNLAELRGKVKKVAVKK